jgi:hypothetical protein
VGVGHLVLVRIVPNFFTARANKERANQVALSKLHCLIVHSYVHHEARFHFSVAFLVIFLKQTFSARRLK